MEPMSRCDSCGHFEAAHVPSNRACLACKSAGGPCDAVDARALEDDREASYALIPPERQPHDAAIDEEWRTTLEREECRTGGIARFIDDEGYRLYKERLERRESLARALDDTDDVEPVITDEDRRTRYFRNLMRRPAPKHVVSPLGDSLPAGGGGGNGGGVAKQPKPSRGDAAAQKMFLEQLLVIERSTRERLSAIAATGRTNQAANGEFLNQRFGKT
jgi:hypothetical protein